MGSNVKAFVFLIAAVTSVTTAGPAYAATEKSSACSTLLTSISDAAYYPYRKLEGLYRRLLAGNVFDEFKLEVFAEALKKFEADPALLPNEGIFEEELAYWEASLSRLAPKGAAVSLIPSLMAEDWTTRYRLYRSIRGETYDVFAYFRAFSQMKFSVRGPLRLESGVRIEQISRFLDDVYLMNHIELGPRIRDLLSSQQTRILNEKLRLMAQREIDREGLETFFKSRKLVGSPIFADKIRELMRSEAWAMAITAFTNLKITSGIMGIVPEADFLTAIRKWGPAFYKDGIDKHWPEFVAEFRRPQLIQARYDAFRKAWYFSGMVIGGYFAYIYVQEKFNEQDAAFQAATAALQDQINEQRKILESQKQKSPGQIAFAHWVSRYQKEHGGKKPDPQSKEYREASKLYLDR